MQPWSLSELQPTKVKQGKLVTTHTNFKAGKQSVSSQPTVAKQQPSASAVKQQ